MWSRLFKRLQTWAIAGMVVLLPVWVTYVTLKWVFDLVDSALRDLLIVLIGRHIPGLGATLTVLVILAVGMVASHFIGQRFFALANQLLMRLPVIRAIYSMVKPVTDAVLGNNTQAFTKVVIVEFPKSRSYSLGFITGELGEFVNVWVPTIPTPTAGFLLHVHREDAMFLDMSVEEGMKMMLSGGIFTPKGDKLDMLSVQIKQFEQSRRAGGA